MFDGNLIFVDILLMWCYLM